MAVLHQESVLAMIKEFRRNWHTLCASERTTLCGADAMLLVLQLSMAENNKQRSGEFTVSLSEVLLTWKHLLHEKLNLPVENMEAIDHYEDIRRTYDNFLKSSNMLDLIDVYKKCSVLTSNCENNANISASQLRDFLSGRQSAVDDETDLCVPPSPVSEHWSQDNEKVATSFVRTIQLGGKGYAPSPSDPLRTHIKGLSNFINFIDKLDEILGEISNPRSPIQVNNSLVKPLRERLHRSMEEKKIKMKQTLIRSQFSCTYKDDCLISRNTWNNVNSASKPSCVLHMENDLSEGVNSSVGRPTIGTSSGNVHLDRSKNEKVERKSSSQTGNKSSKRKQVDLDDENILCDNGNEPPQHKNVKIPKTSNDLQNKLHGKPARVAKSNKCTAKDKLITGQTKLTQFFRL
ncbi:PCNA-interacting partner isoform X13 [Pteronotus mesoamericanus]|uniref:PCNA-interacting partner isoform X13 n=1 Tax=Pteronotus mesoamericanus TaxID=1884717 RepID=UPI0023ECAD71|nr:PCNA-interacting partner isoform X13 [Pteronotus parnellii mesoamericanus]